MTREEQLLFCKKCVSRKMDLKQGLLCAISGAKANFAAECANFQLDTAVPVELNETEPVSEQLQNNISIEAFEKLKLEQNLPIALIAGIAVGVVGALLWGAITVITNYQIGYMAIAIGAAVGYSMRLLGKGMDQIFGISGALIAVLSCVLGNFFSIIGYIANSEGLGYMETFILFDFSLFVPIMTETFSVMDILFYGIAGYEGYRFAFRVFTDKDVAGLS